MAQDLHGVEKQLQRHEGLDRELAGMEQQVSRLLSPASRVLLAHLFSPTGLSYMEELVQEVLGLIPQNGNIAQGAWVILSL